MHCMVSVPSSRLAPTALSRPLPSSRGREFSGAHAIGQGLCLTLGSLIYLFIDASSDVAAFWWAAWLCTVLVRWVFLSAYRSTGDVLNPLSLGMVYFGLLFPFHGMMMIDNRLVIAFHGIDRHLWFGRGLLVAG